MPRLGGKEDGRAGPGSEDGVGWADPGSEDGVNLAGPRSEDGVGCRALHGAKILRPTPLHPVRPDLYPSISGFFGRKFSISTHIHFWVENSPFPSIYLRQLRSLFRCYPLHSKTFHEKYPYPPEIHSISISIRVTHSMKGSSWLGGSEIRGRRRLGGSGIGGRRRLGGSGIRGRRRLGGSGIIGRRRLDRQRTSQRCTGEDGGAESPPPTPFSGRWGHLAAMWPGSLHAQHLNPRTPGGFGRTPTPGGGLISAPPYDLENYAG